MAERQGRLRPPRREVGLALVGIRGGFIITRLTRSWYLIRVWPFGLYALTNYVGKLWALDVVVSAEAFVTSATERRAPGWTA